MVLIVFEIEMSTQQFRKQMIDREISNYFEKIEDSFITNPNNTEFIFEQLEFIEKYLSSNIPIIQAKNVNIKQFPILTSSRQLSAWTTPEKIRISKRVENWDPENSEAWRQLQSIYGDRIQLRFLREIAEQLSDQLKIYLDRDAKRRKIVLIKWFEEHWEELNPLLRNWSISQGKIHQINHNDDVH